MAQAIDANRGSSGLVPGRKRPRELIERAADFIAGIGAASRLGGTNYGSMCEKAANFAHSSVRCGKCDGFGFLGFSREKLDQRARQIADEHNPERREALRQKWNRDSTCPCCRGTGYLTGATVRTLMDSTWTTVHCPSCRSSGKRRRRSEHDVELAALLGLDIDTCVRCHGRGYLVPVTVRETGSSKHGRMPPGSTDTGDDVVVRPHEPTTGWADDEAIVELAQMSRLMDRLRGSDPTAAAVLDLYYGVDGDRYGPHRWGRAFAIWPLTHAGKQMAGYSAKASGFNLRPIERIANERNRSELAAVPDLRLRSVLARADREARALLNRAHRALREAAL